MPKLTRRSFWPERPPRRLVLPCSPRCPARPRPPPGPAPRALPTAGVRWRTCSTSSFSCRRTGASTTTSARGGAGQRGGNRPDRPADHERDQGRPGGRDVPPGVMDRAQPGVLRAPSRPGRFPTSPMPTSPASPPAPRGPSRRRSRWPMKARRPPPAPTSTCMPTPATPTGPGRTRWRAPRHGWSPLTSAPASATGRTT